MTTSSSLSALMEQFDEAVELQQKYQKEMEKSPAYIKLQEISKRMSEITEQLKVFAKAKGDFMTKYYRFASYDRRTLDYKGLVDKLIKTKKVTEKFVAQFVEIKTIISASPMKKDDK